MEQAARSPFYSDGPIPPALAEHHFHGFEEERRDLAQLLNKRTPTKVAIVGPRRSGKTSLILAASTNVLAPRAHIDCSRIFPSTVAGFYRLLLEALELPPPSRAPQGPPREAYPQIPFSRKGTRTIVVLENAPALDEIEPHLLDEIDLLAKRLPNHLLLTGEAKRIGPLGDAAIATRPFGAATSTDFLRRRLTDAGLNVDEEAFERAYEYTSGGVMALQRLGDTLWRQATRAGRSRISASDIDAALIEVVERLPSELLASWSAIRGITRDVFVAMCLLDLESPTEIANRIGLQPKNVIVLLSRLIQPHGLVEKSERGRYVVPDKLLKHYVRKEWASPILR